MADSENKPAEKIQLQQIVEEMKISYLDYAMSVIVSRALPDVRDGLKPVHRRILYAMWDIGLKPGAKFRKSATVVGEVLGKYHPHGDSAVYDSLVRLAQNFSMRYPLAHGQGNFGSVDGDAAAAMRYTEVKLAKITEEMLTDIEKNTVDFRNNYDGAHKEPTVLPSKLPNLLLNGTLGIAVGMATNIPPHNVCEICDAILNLIKNPESTVEDLMEFVKGPDFPTGGIIFDEQAIKQAYATGRGSIVMRAKCSIVEGDGGYKILVDELPYQVNKAELIEKIAELVKEEKIKGIKGLRDESDRNGMRITIELKKDSFPKKVLNQLYSFTRLQDSFHVNMLALIDGIQPRVLSLKMVLEEYIKHRQIVIRRRTEFDLQNARDREHILIGLVLALEDIDAIIETIKKSRDKNDARENLIKRFRLSERQAEAILEMRLRALAGLERLLLEKELEEKRKLIKELEAILKDQKKILGIINDELAEIKKTYGDERKTQVMSGPVKSFSQEDLIPKEAAIIMITKDGYIKRLAPQSFRAQGRGGSGVTGLTRKEEDIVLHLLSADTHDDILFFTNSGKVFRLKAFEVPEASRTSKGNAVVNFLELDQSESVTALLALDKKSQEKFFIMATQNGVIKKVEASEFKNVRRSGLIAINLREGDVLKWVKLANEKQDIMLGTSRGLAIRFSEKELRPIGRNAQGVTGIRLSKGNAVVGMDIVDKTEKDAYLLSISENGCGKMTRVDEYRSQSRGGKGVKTMQITKKTGELTTSWVVYPKNLPEGANGDLILISKLGQVIRISLSSVPHLGRATQGVRLMRLKQKGDTVAQVALV
ncbi:MAG: gyrase subunit A protein [Parcubacteria group bacterium GW2011_GWC2_44_17]|nr:MAG: gyrase subunit A protein [Parcubacteria group bacterium GW2011_GWC2_44_17]